MGKAVGKIKPKKVAVIVRADGTREVIEPQPTPDFGDLSMPGAPQKKKQKKDSEDEEEGKEKAQKTAVPRGRLIAKA